MWSYFPLEIRKNILKTYTFPLIHGKAILCSSFQLSPSAVVTNILAKNISKIYLSISSRMFELWLEFDNGGLTGERSEPRRPYSRLKSQTFFVFVSSSALACLVIVIRKRSVGFGLVERFLRVVRQALLYRIIIFSYFHILYLKNI